MRNIVTGNHNQTRYSNGVFHPQMSAPRIPANNGRLSGWKKSPGFTGKRGPYGNRASDAGGFALQAPAKIKRSNSLAPKAIPPKNTPHQRNPHEPIAPRHFRIGILRNSGHNVVSMGLNRYRRHFTIYFWGLRWGIDLKGCMRGILPAGTQGRKMKLLAPVQLCVLP